MCGRDRSSVEKLILDSVHVARYHTQHPDRHRLWERESSFIVLMGTILRLPCWIHWKHKKLFATLSRHGDGRSRRCSTGTPQLSLACQLGQEQNLWWEYVSLYNLHVPFWSQAITASYSLSRSNPARFACWVSHSEFASAQLTPPFGKDWW